jgi:hypothetical protein
MEPFLRGIEIASYIAGVVSALLSVVRLWQRRCR